MTRRPTALLPLLLVVTMVASGGLVASSAATSAAGARVAGSAGAAGSAGSARTTRADRAKAFAPKPGAIFGRPGHNDIRAAIVRAIDHAPRGSVIRGVTWSFNDTVVSDALLAAHRRGVVVQVLTTRRTAEEKGNDAVRDLKAGLSEPSFAKIANGAARKGLAFDEPGTMHQKSWTFSRTGSVRFVSIVTSANVTTTANQMQYNDAYRFVGYREVFTAIRRVFNQQIQKRTWPRPYRQFTISPLTSLSFSPWNSPSMADPVVRRIQSLPTSGLIIRAASAAWSGGRGANIARALAAKKRAGARVFVVASKPFSDAVRGILRDADIPIQNAYFGENRYMHSKFMTAFYRVGGKPQTRVWTGSENWGTGPRANDELTAMIGSRDAHRAYVRWFDYLADL